MASSGVFPRHSHARTSAGLFWMDRQRLELVLCEQEVGNARTRTMLEAFDKFFPPAGPGDIFAEAGSHEFCEDPGIQVFGLETSFVKAHHVPALSGLWEVIVL